MDIAIKVLIKHAKGKQKKELTALLDGSFQEMDSVCIFDLQKKCRSGDSPKLIVDILISMDGDGDLYLLNLLDTSRPTSGWHVGRNNVVKLLAEMGDKCLPFITRNVSNGSEDIGALMSALDIKGLLTNEILDLVSKKYQTDMNSGSGWMRSSNYSNFMDGLSFDSAMYIISKRKAKNWDDFYAAIPAAMRSLANLSKFGRLKDVNGRFIADSTCKDAIFALNDSVTDVTLGSKIRWSAANALGNIGDRNSVQNLLKIFLDDKDEFVRGSAALALGKIGDTSVVPMLNEVFSKQRIVTSIEDDIPYGLHRVTTLTAGILEALALFKDQSSLEFFISLLKNECALQHYEACLLIGSFQNQRVLPLLEEIISNREDVIGRGEDYISSLDDFEDQFGDKAASANEQIIFSYEIISAALFSIGNIGAPWSAQTVRYYIEHKDKNVRENAILALAKLTSPSDPLFTTDVISLFKALVEENQSFNAKVAKADILAEALSIISTRFPDKFCDIFLDAVCNKELTISRDMESLFKCNFELESSLARRVGLYYPRISNDYPIEIRLTALHLLKCGGNLAHIETISKFMIKNCDISPYSACDIEKQLTKALSGLLDSSFLNSNNSDRLQLPENKLQTIRSNIINNTHFNY